MASENNIPDDLTSPQASFHSQLAAHQRKQDWEGQSAATVLQRWVPRFNDEFKLEIPEIAIRLDVLPVSQLGAFRGEHNGLGIEREVTINSLYLCGDRPRIEPFTTCIHQLLHAWQYGRGINQPNYVHNAEYRRKAREIGLDVTPKGLTRCIEGGPFLELLASHGIVDKQQTESAQDNQQVHNVTKPVDGRLKGSSKLRKYSCGCTTVRVAHKNFRAQCLNCGNEFASDSANTSDSYIAPDTY